MSHARLVLQGSASNTLRLLLSILSAAFLPPFLVRHLSQAEYSAWVLILQLSAYVSLLDLGLQTAVGKFVAEYHAMGDRETNRRLVSTSLSTIIGAAVIAAGFVVVMVVRVPELFHQMPQGLLSEVRLSLLVVGLSSAFALPFSPFLSVFTGLQDYGFPTVLTIISKVLSGMALMALLVLHRGLVELALAIAFFNVATALAQFQGWRKYARELVAFSFPFFDRKSAIQLTKYSGVLVIWTLAGLCVSGLDLVIVGHFDYKNTGFYAVGASVTNFMLMIVTGTMGPLIPAISSLQAGRTPGQIGDLTVRATRYGTLLICLSGLPLVIGAYPLLNLWVGREYAVHSVLFLQLLVLGNIIRQLAYPYSLVVVATGKQHLATGAAIAEAVVNLGLSIWLAQRMGALGVAIGTLAGAFVSLCLHFVVSMRLTKPTVSFERQRLLMQGLLRPLACILPSLLLYPYWERRQMIASNSPLLVVWFVCTAAIAWTIGLKAVERHHIIMAVLRRDARVH
jgi:O-antigen/teichoic acid export membrane protein